MNKEQMQKFRSKLGGKMCPICKNPILQFYSFAYTEITELEKESYNQIDTSKDYVNLECMRCGYIMTFNKEILFR